MVDDIVYSPNKYRETEGTKVSQDPTAFVRSYYDKKKKTIYIFDEFYEKEVFTDDLADYLMLQLKGEIVTCDSSEPRSIADLKRRGVKAIPAKKGPGSIEHGIKWVQSNKIVVHDKCINTIKELSSYKWKEDKDGNVLPKPVDMNNHLIDALRYSYEGEMKQNKIRTLDKTALGL